MKKLLFVFNPTAGKSRIRTKLVDIIDLFVKDGYLVTTYPTQKKSDAERITREDAGNYDLLVCSGGDGTLNEVVTGMLDRTERIPIGYIPTGTTNDYARSLGIPKGMIQAAKLAVRGKLFQTDIGSLNGRTFVYVAAFGIFTDVSYQTSQQAKNAFGHSAYVFEGMKRIASIRPYHMKVEIDGEEMEDDFIYGMVSNTISVGGFTKITSSGVLLDDGKFEVMFVKNPKNPLEFQEIVGSLLLDGVHSQFVCEYKAKRVKVQSDESVAWTLDGEYGGEHTEVVIENKANAISLMADTDNISLSAENHLKNAITQYEKRE